MALITASLPLIVVVIDQPSQLMPKARLLGFLTYPMCLGEILRFCAGEKVPRPVAVNRANSRNVPRMRMETTRNPLDAAPTVGRMADRPTFGENRLLRGRREGHDAHFMRD